MIKKWRGALAGKSALLVAGTLVASALAAVAPASPAQASGCTEHDLLTSYARATVYVCDSNADGSLTNTSQTLCVYAFVAWDMPNGSILEKDSPAVCGYHSSTEFFLTTPSGGVFHSTGFGTYRNTGGGGGGA